jgi:hypothetical protein
MVTPWFAAGAGIVIAAALAVDSPAALTYGPAGPGLHCTAAGCASPAPGHQPDLATASPGVQLKTPAAGGSGVGGAAEASAGRRHGEGAGDGASYRLGYQIIRRWPSGFVAMITLPGDLKPGPWSLQFAYPSAHVDRVWGALWQPSSNGNGGTALGPGPGRGWARAQPDGRQLAVSATGTPTEPSGCRLNGVSCDFGG